MELIEILELISDDLVEVNEKLVATTQSEVTLINDISDYIISSGGKRIRPILVLLFAKLLKLEDQSQAIELAAITELIHTATILHDDVVDDSSMRRGLKTANKQFNNPAAVLVGDFIYTRAFQLIAKFNSTELMSIYTDAVNVIAEGEVKQLTNLGDVDITEQNYLDVIYSKTAKLFEVACRAVAYLKYPNDPAKQNRLASYGVHLGTAFQIIDDVLDYNTGDATLGKSQGDDLAEGKPTLPLIRLKEVGSISDQELVNNIILQKIGREALDTVLEAINRNHCFDYCYQVANEEAKKAKYAIADTDESIYKDALNSLVDISISREY